MTLILLPAVFLSILVGWFFRIVWAKNILPVVWPMYIAVLVFLGLTFIFGAVTRGSVRWLSFGGIKLQASEIAKPIMILVSVYFFSKS